MKTEIEEVHQVRQVKDAREIESWQKKYAELLKKNKQLEGKVEMMDQMEKELLTQSQQITLLQAENHRSWHEKEDLHMDLETLKQSSKEMQKAHDCWMETAHVFNGKYKEAVGFVNSAVPNFIDVFEKAERNASAIHTPLEVEEFLALCRGMVKKWNVISGVG